MTKDEPDSPLRRVGWGRIPLPWTRRRRRQAEQRGQQLLLEAIARRERAAARGDAEQAVLGRDTTRTPSAPYGRDQIRTEQLAKLAEWRNQGYSARTGHTGGIVAEPKRDETIITMWGEIDDSLRFAASSAITTALESNKPVTLDLSEVSFIDSTGVAFLVQVSSNAAREGTIVSLRGASNAAKSAMEMLGVLGMFDSDASTSPAAPHTQSKRDSGGRPSE